MYSEDFNVGGSHADAALDAASVEGKKVFIVAVSPGIDRIGPILTENGAEVVYSKSVLTPNNVQPIIKEIDQLRPDAVVIAQVDMNPDLPYKDAALGVIAGLKSTNVPTIVCGFKMNVSDELAVQKQGAYCVDISNFPVHVAPKLIADAIAQHGKGGAAGRH